VNVSLPNEVTIELPRNWVIISQNQRITLDSAVEAGLDLSGFDYLNSELPFAANYFDDAGNAKGLINLRYYPDMSVTQDDASKWSRENIEELDSGLEKSIRDSENVSGLKVTAWKGTESAILNGVFVFITEYERASSNPGGDFSVRLVRVLAGSQSLTMTISYQLQQGVLLKPVTDKIIESLAIGRIEAFSGNGSGVTKADSTSIEDSPAVLYFGFMFVNSGGQLPKPCENATQCEGMCLPTGAQDANSGKYPGQYQSTNELRGCTAYLGEGGGLGQICMD
jgi:hypothetical protein